MHLSLCTILNCVAKMQIIVLFTCLFCFCTIVPATQSAPSFTNVVQKPLPENEETQQTGGSSVWLVEVDVCVLSNIANTHVCIIKINNSHNGNNSIAIWRILDPHHSIQIATAYLNYKKQHYEQQDNTSGYGIQQHRT